MTAPSDLKELLAIYAVGLALMGLIEGLARITAVFLADRLIAKENDRGR